MKLPFNGHKVFWIIVVGFIFFSTSYAEEEAFAGKYDLIKTPQPTNDSEKIEVVELFWYNCPHCFQFEQFLSPWLEKQPSDVEVIFMPAIFNESWGILAKAYYTAEVLGILGKTHHALFEAIHVKKRKIKTEQDIQTFFAEYGIKPEEFNRVYNGFSVDTKTRRANLMTRKYGITGVPALIINGKYRISGSNVTSYGEMVEVVNHLIQKEREQMALKLKDSVGTPTTASDSFGTPATAN